MKITSPSEDKIIVELSNQDMLELDITYENMDYSTIETRRVIWTVLDAAGKVLDRDLDPSRRMVIEAIPKPDGGCILVFTVMNGCKNYQNKKPLLKKQPESLLCEFDSLDNLYRCAEGLNLNNEIESSLYENSGKYRLILTSPYEIGSIRRHFSEFCLCENCETLKADFTREHWKTLAQQNALKLISLPAEQAP